MIRRITNKELCDLPEAWENSRIDGKKYHESVTAAYEVDAETYQELKKAGDLCQEYNGRFYVGVSCGILA